MIIFETAAGSGDPGDWIERAVKAFIPSAMTEMVRVLVKVQAEISPYPPQPDRMRSGKLNTYVRGVGRYPKSAFVPETSEPGGFKVRKTKRAQIRHTSQDMASKYRMSVQVTDSNIEGRLWNEADYSGWVIGPKEGDPHQVAFHTETGWPNQDDVMTRLQPEIDAHKERAIASLMDTLRGGG